MRHLLFACRLPLLLAFFLFLPSISMAFKTENILFVMTDGVRWHEAFNGADPDLMPAEDGKGDDSASLKKKYWRDTPEQRREALMPFTWKTVVPNGQIFGNRAKGSEAHVSNGFNFSYPGFNEALTGYGDPRVNSNNKTPNPNISVFEWLNRMPEFSGKTGAFAAWDVFPFIFNAERCGFPVNAGFDAMTQGKINTRIELLNRLKVESARPWGGEPYDCLTYHTAFEWLKENHPRLFFLALGETDEWGHAGNYKEYLDGIRRYDMYVQELWETVQSLPQYKDKTTLILSTDHGRGVGPEDWKSHGEEIKFSEQIWMAWMGPDTPALGERSQVEAVTLSQVAATIATLLGKDFNQFSPQAGKPIASVIPKDQ